ncbi:MAG: OmpA family protein [Paludibacter sp.]|nr:OmpA family protein [Paludibacter sp.]
MKTNNMYKKESRFARFPYALSIKDIFLAAVILVGVQSPMQAQNEAVQYTQPSWYFGVAAGGNINFYRGSTQQLNAELTVPTTFHDGTGFGLFVAPLIEYRPANSRWGIMFEGGYDSRKGAFNSVTTPCNCPADLITDLSYLTIEPSLRFAPFKSDLYLYAGPRLAFNLNKAFTYQLGLNPDIPGQLPTDPVNEDFSSIRPNMLSMQIGAGYDIHLTSVDKKTQFILSPFVSFQPYFGQDPRTIETWNVTTLRVGAALKLGSGHAIKKAINKDVLVPIAAIVEPEVKFYVDAPKNSPSVTNVREIFPLGNYVYFDLGSTKIPSRYVQLNKNQVKDFRQDQVELTTPENFSGRSNRQMIVYYNILNIIGDRMVKSPKSSITLIGSSEQGPEDARLMAESTKDYLVNIWGINPSRISVEGRSKPLIASVKKGGTVDLVLLQEGDRKVSIESSSPELLMEFYSGTNAMRPIEIVSGQIAPPDSYVFVNAEGGINAYTSWSVEFKDEKGAVQNFGPYTQDKISIPRNKVLGTRPEGDYKVTLVGQTKTGKVLRKETLVHIVNWSPATTQEATRFSVMYEFNSAKTIEMYEKYINEVVVPKIPKNGTVIIRGHADITGSETYNMNLSLARANDVQSIMQNSLKKAGRTDVTFEVDGYGEDISKSPFENKFPEQRYYNRTVIIDIVPQK